MLNVVWSRLSYFIRFLVVPSFCASCKKWLSHCDILCEHCKLLIAPLVSLDLPISKKKQVAVVALSAYRDPIKALVLAKSSSNVIAGKQLGILVWDMTTISTMSFDYIVPVPLHWSRYAWRGFNQAYEMAYVISQKSKKPILAITRTKKTVFQSSISVDKREQNVENIFKISSDTAKKIDKKTILIVDDVMTTGATIKSLAKLLYLHKAHTVCAVVAARPTR